MIMKRLTLICGLFILASAFCTDVSAQGFLSKLKNKAKEVKQKVENVTKGETRKSGKVNSVSDILDGSDSEISSEEDGEYKRPKIHRDLPEGKISIPKDDGDMPVTHAKRYKLKSNRPPKISDFHDGMAVVETDDEVFFINELGEKIIPEVPIVIKPRNSYNVAERFDGGHILVRLKAGGYAIMNKKGEVVKNISSSVRDGAGFSDGVGVLIKTHSDGLSWQMQYIDVDGNDIWPALSVKTGALHPELRPLQEGLRPVRKLDPADKHDKWGFADSKGVMKIAPRFGNVEGFSDGLAAVQEFKGEVLFGNKWGFINSEGKLVIDFIFSQKPGNFNHGRAVVKTSSGDQVIINKNGDILYEIPNNWQITDFSKEGYAIYWGAETDGNGVSERVAYCVKDTPEKKVSFATFDDYFNFEYSSEDDGFYIKLPGGFYIPMNEQTMESERIGAIRPFINGFGVLPNGAFNSITNHFIVVFEPNKF